MDRLFLAIIVSGLLLAAVATSLFVATGGGNTVAVVNAPPVIDHADARSPLPAALRITERATDLPDG